MIRPLLLPAAVFARCMQMQGTGRGYWRTRQLHVVRGDRSSYSTLAPSQPSAGAAAGNQIFLGRLLRARYLKLSTFLPLPRSEISPRPPRPDLQP